MTQIRKDLLVAAVVLSVGLVAVLFPVPKAAALAGPVSGIDSCSVTCGTSATKVVCDGVAAGGFQSAYIQNNGTNAVALGDASLTTTTAPIICTGSNCNRFDWSGDVTNLYCRGAASQAIVVIAGK